MQRKTGAVEIKLQSHVLSYKPASFLEKRDGNKLVVLPLLNDGNSKASTSSINKELVFTFDALLIPETNSTASTKTDVLEDVNSSLDKTFSTSIELLLLGYDATCLLYGSKQEIGDNDDNIKQLITRYCRLLYSKLQTTSPPIQSKQVPHNSILDNIQVSVYEILESQVRDLVSSSECRIRDGVGGQVILDGVSEHACTSYAAFESTLDKALLGRTHIALGESERGVAGHKLSALENIANVNYTILGELGTTVVHFTIRQSVYIPHATTETHVTRGSTLKLVVLPTSDLLTMAIEYGGYKCIGSQQALSQGMISTKAKGMLDWYLGSNLVHTSSATTTSTIGISQVKASLKALSTLSRVVDNLALRSSNPTQKVHIPYRDSVLTRYLRSSLEGNCFLSMLTFPSCSDREQASRALRFAASIGQLHRVIWCKEEVVMSSIISNKSIAFQTGKQDYFDTIESLPNTHTHTSGAGDPLLDTGTGAIANFEVSTPIKQTTHLFIQSSLDFVQAQAAMESEISSLTYGLNEIERLRLACLSSLMNVTQVKQYTYNMNGGFCNAISDVQDEDESGYNHMNEYEDDRYGIKGAINESKASMLPSIGSVGLASPSSLLAVSETKSLDVRSVAKHAQQLRAGSRQSLPPLQSPSSKEKRAPAKILLDNSKSQTMTDDSSANNRQVMKPSRRGSEQLSTMSGTRGNKTVLASPVNPRSPHAHGVISSSSAPSTPSRTSHISGAALSPVKKLVAAVLSGSSGSNTVPRHKSTTRRLGVEKSAQSLLFGSTITSTKKPPATFSFVPVQSRSSRLSFEIKATTNSDASYRVSSLTFEDQNGVVCEELLEPSHYSPSNGDTSALSAHDGRFMALKHDISALADSPPLTNEKAFGDDEVGGADIREGSYHFSTNNATQIAMSSPSPFPYLSTNVDLDKLDCENYSIPAGASQPVSGQEEEHGESDDDWTDEDEGVESLVELLRARLHENAPKKSTSSINDAQDRNSLHHLKRGRITEGGRRMKRHDAMEESDPSPTTKKMTRRIRDVEPSDLMEQSDDDDLSLLERTFLRNVARCNVVEVQVNVREGVNIHVKNTFERGAMQIAARNGSIPMLSLLHSSGGELPSRGPKGETLFHLAAYNGHVPTLRWLHAVGLLPEAVDMYGQTAAHVAARRGELSVLQYLHGELGVDVLDCEDFDGRKPIECIPRRGPVELQACKKYLQMLKVENMEVNELLALTNNVVENA